MSKKLKLICLVFVLTMVVLAPIANAAKLELLWWESGEKLEWLQSLVDRYMELNPGVEINLETVPWDEYWSKMPVLMAAGRAPDVMFMVSGNVQRYAALDGLVDMSPYLSDDYLAKLYEPHVEMVTFEGNKIAALPFTLTVPTMFYNKGVAEKAGINPPQTLEDAWTWEEFEEAVVKMQKAAGSPYGVHIVTRDFWRLPFLYQNNAAVLNDTKTGSAINSPQAIEALEFLRDLHVKGIASSPTDSMADDMFMSGLIPVVMGAHWDMGMYQRTIDGFEYGVTFVPHKEKHAVALGGDFLAVYKQTKYPAEAVKFVQWLSSPEVNEEYIVNNYYLSPHKDAQVQYPGDQDLMDLVALQASVGSSSLTSHRAIPQWDVFLGVLNAEFELVLMGEKEPAKAVEIIEKSINEALAR